MNTKNPSSRSKRSTTSLQLKPTPEIEEGPFYLAGSPQRADLIEEGIPGEKLVLTGQVLGIDGKPVTRAWLDFWQANGNGYYDISGYTLRGHQYTDKSGKYRLYTVIPGGYAGRTPHIHVKVRADSNSPILTTQLFFPGLASNQADFLYRDDLLIKMQDTSNGKQATFGFVVKK